MSALSVQVNPEKVPSDCTAAREEQHICFNHYAHKILKKNKHTPQTNCNTEVPEH